MSSTRDYVYVSGEKPGGAAEPAGSVEFADEPPQFSCFFGRFRADRTAATAEPFFKTAWRNSPHAIFVFDPLTAFPLISGGRIKK